MDEIKIRPLVELLRVLRDNTDKIVMWQLPIEGIMELAVFHDMFTLEERYVLVGLLIEWGIKPDEYVVEPIWNLLDKIIDFYENH
jgi:hypothetical protein